MRDKRAFALRCSEYDIPHPPLRAWRAEGRTVAPGPVSGGRLFVKPSTGTAGIGAQIIACPPNASSQELIRHLDHELGRRVDWIGQDILVNHPQIARFTLGALSTLRLTTFQNETGATELVGAIFKIATDPSAIADNFAGGSISAGVDADSGQLRPGNSWSVHGLAEANPATGVRFVGETLPFFEEAKRLALTSHDLAFSEYAYVGWDIAITPDGPLMLEGNPRGSLSFVRKIGACATTRERFAELVAVNIARVPRKRLARWKDAS